MGTRPHCPSTWTTPRSPARLLHPPATGQSNCRRPAKVVDAEQARILLKKAATWTRCGNAERAIDTLRQAEALLPGVRDPRLTWLVRYNLALSLWELRRYTEAEALLPTVRELAAGLGNELDVVRGLWLEGRVAAGLGRREEALQALERVRRYFTSEQIAYDAALASLEVAVLYLEAGRTGEVKRLAEEMVWVFKAQGVKEEALAALRLFCEAAGREAATVELARRAVEAFRKGAARL